MVARLLPVLGAVILLAACAAPPAGGGPEGDRIVGTVRVAGSAPMDVHVLLEPDEGEAVRVVGPKAQEIGRLAGGQVAIQGRAVASEHPITKQQIDPVDYEIMAMNGEPVTEGTVEGRTGAWTVLRTRGGELIYLASVPESVRTGDRIWVQGPRAVVVQSYGVVRPR